MPNPMDHMVVVATAAGTNMGYQTVLKAIALGATTEQLAEFCKYAIEDAIPKAMGSIPEKLLEGLDIASTAQAEAIIEGKVIGGGAHVMTVSIDNENKDEDDLW